MPFSDSGFLGLLPIQGLSHCIGGTKTRKQSHKMVGEEISRLKENALVRCVETGRIGIVVEKKRAAWSTMALVVWPRVGQRWVDVTELEFVHKG